MPAHIYQRTGDFDQAAAANIAAIKAERAYVERTDTQGSLYDMMYYTHNLHFLVMACSMQGNSKCALETADAMTKHVEPSVRQMNMLEGFLAWAAFHARAVPVMERHTWEICRRRRPNARRYELSSTSSLRTCRTGSPCQTRPSRRRGGARRQDCRSQWRQGGCR